ncbi:ectoine synthase [Saccharothrix australiensis]|uniref:L-ectoine synthase n=1 Tax=Saccharothrix australiensis TaxID=2072 RepID=A0A495VZR2_9PSEU|nr:ectoine synthase [Saccharothrix australiensis]RKT54247.1 L-ectoine synthase [Saccharothrix australiensis]
MIVRTRENLTPVDWGNGLSYRLLVQSDGMGFTLAETVVRAGTSSRLQYRRHLEACYCTSGSGAVVSADGQVRHELRPGVLYALDEHDAHHLIADEGSDLVLISVFNPPLSGSEKHVVAGPGFSSY